MNINSYRPFLPASSASPHHLPHPNMFALPGDLHKSAQNPGSFLLPNPGLSLPPGANPGLPHPLHPHDMPFYPGLPGAFGDLKEMMSGDGGAGWRPAFNPYASPNLAGAMDGTLAAAGIYANNPYCQNNFSAMDPNAMNRRKNATRETTSQLKQWLYDHRKNPYPTKAEKIWLAISTRMSITQVSTWFANARRRLKKENKMTWSPRNRACEDDDEDADDKSDADLDDTGSEIDVKDIPTTENDTASVTNQQQQPESRESSKPKAAQDAPKPDKPKIWSLADLATGNNNPPPPAPAPVLPNYTLPFDRTRPFPAMWPQMFPSPSPGAFVPAPNSAFSSPLKHNAVTRRDESPALGTRSPIGVPVKRQHDSPSPVQEKRQCIEERRTPVETKRIKSESPLSHSEKSLSPDCEAHSTKSN